MNGSFAFRELTLRALKRRSSHQRFKGR